MLGHRHRLWGNVGRWLRRLGAPAGEATRDTKDKSGRDFSSARFWAELREGRREWDARTSRSGP